MAFRFVPLVLALAGIAALGMAVFAAAAPTKTTRQVAIASIARDGFPPTATPTRTPPPPTATPKPPPYDGPVASLYLASGGIWGTAPIEVRDTHWESGHEAFDNPTAPWYIAHYRRFGHPGNGGANSIFAAHVNYIGYGNGPFAGLAGTTMGDTLWVTMANGTVYGYTVNDVRVVRLTALDMNTVVYPGLPASKERITLISCGGTFIPAAVGGEYDSRVIVVAERYVE